VKASRILPTAKVAASSSGSSNGLRKASRKIASMSDWLALPPAPCARVISFSRTRGGTPGTLDALEHQLLPANVLGPGGAVHPRVPGVVLGVVRTAVLGDSGFGPGRPLLLGGVLVGHALLAPIWLASRTRSRLNRPKL
jgi:hypothetical protein